MINFKGYITYPVNEKNIKIKGNGEDNYKKQQSTISGANHTRNLVMIIFP